MASDTKTHVEWDSWVREPMAGAGKDGSYMTWDTSGPWKAEVDEDEPTEIALTAANGRYAYGFEITEARRIRDALNELPDSLLEDPEAFRREEAERERRRLANFSPRTRSDLDL